MADVSVTLMANRHFNLKIESADPELKKKILTALDPIFRA
jgi:hypothetical protein